MKWNVAFVTLASLPAVAFLTTVLYAVYAMTVVGHWPYYAHPDPKNLPDGVLDHFVTGAFLGGVISVLLFPGIALFLAVHAMWKERWPARVQIVAVAVFCCGVGLWVADVQIRGSRSLLEWLLD